MITILTPKNGYMLTQSASNPFQRPRLFWSSVMGEESNYEEWSMEKVEAYRKKRTNPLLKKLNI